MKTQKFDFRNFIGLSFRLKNKDGNYEDDVIRVKDVDNSIPSIYCDGGLKFVCKKNKWYLTYLGLANEECINLEHPYTLWPIEIGCISRQAGSF